MKKVFLSLGVIFFFIFYSWHQQKEAAGVRVVTPSLSPTSVPMQSALQATPTSGSGSTPPPSVPTAAPTAKLGGQYRDGQYTGYGVDAAGHGTMQVKAIISGGKLTDVQFLQYPSNGETSVNINTQAMPYLKQEAITAQNAHVDIIGGATESTYAFQQSLGSALSQAKI